MPIDHYAACPCGSGKKLKFCKCFDQTQEYEKILKLIEGEQNLAAVDRINHLLAKTPNAAWLLAIKGELYLEMEEFDCFRETADRFLKLKPDNPLALIMKSIASALSEEPAETIAHYLLMGMSESRDTLPRLTDFALRLLLQIMIVQDRTAMIGYWGDIHDALTSSESSTDSVLKAVHVNLLCKSVPMMVEDPHEAPWRERLAEVLSLARSFRYAQAETKLRATLRDYPDQPGVLSHLLRAQFAQLQQQAAYSTALKLSEHQQLTEDERAYYRALAFELEPGRKSLELHWLLKYCEVDSEQRIEELLSQLDRIELTSGAAADQLREFYASVVQDEVPARKVYSLYDRPVKGRDDKQAEHPEAQLREVVSSAGNLVLFGRQTDRPPRVLLMAHNQAGTQSFNEQLLQQLQLGSELDASKFELRNLYPTYLNRLRFVAGPQEPLLTDEESGQLLIDDFLNMKLALFEGQTPLQAAADEKFRGRLLGLLYHFEGEQNIRISNGDMQRLFEKLGYQRPKAAVDPSAKTIRFKYILELDRIDVTQLGDGQLATIFSRAIRMGGMRIMLRCAASIRQRASLAGETALQLSALSLLLSDQESLKKRSELFRTMISLLEHAKLPIGRVVLDHFTDLVSHGKTQDALEMSKEMLRSHPEDPDMLALMQMLASRGAQSSMEPQDELAARMLRNTSRLESDEQSPSGLVLPGQSRQPQGSGKLWLPGS